MVLVDDSIHVTLHNTRHCSPWIGLDSVVSCCCELRSHVVPDLGNADSLQIVGYLSAGIVMTSSAVEQTIYRDQRATEASAAGFILLAVISVSLARLLFIRSCADTAPRIDNMGLLLRLPTPS